MSLNKDYQTTFTSGVLITDTEAAPNGSSDSIPSFTTVGGEVVSAALEVKSTLGSLLIPRVTQTVRDAMIATDGMMIYNTTADAFNVREASSWVTIAAGAAADLEAVLTAGDDANNQSIVGLTSLSFGTAGTPESIALGVDGAAASGTDATSVAIGSGASAGVDAISIGRAAGVEFTGATNNIAIGFSTLDAINNTGADNNIAIGTSAASTLTSGFNNICVGQTSGASITSGTNNICLGLTSDCGDLAQDGIALGRGAVSGTDAISIGRSAGAYSFLATNNIAIGTGAVDSINGIGANNNIGIGVNAGNSITSGTNNTCVGTSAGGSITTGGTNSAFGSNANCAATASNQTAIGNGTVTTALNQLYLGNASVATISGQVAFTTYSDGRFKKNIKDLSLGVDFINSLSPKFYNVDTKAVQEFRSKAKVDESEFKNFESSSEKTWCGLIAQDLKKSLEDAGASHLSFVDTPEDEAKEVYGVRYTEFVPVLINAIKELSARIQKLEGSAS